jgi:glycine/D-amino acid oxidase-like deaminating enzyme
VPHRVLTRDVQTDVLIVGAGVSGALIAEGLSADHRVILVDRRGPVKGSTPASTALVEYEIDTPLTHLARKIGKVPAERAWQRSQLALHALAARTRDLGIRCELERRDNLYLAGTLLNKQELEEEGEARRAAGIETTFLSRKVLKDRFGLSRSGALLGYDDLAVNPRAMAVGYLIAAIHRGAELFSPVEVIEIETGRSGIIAMTKSGPTIRCETIVYATGYEMPAFVPAHGHEIASTYAIATKPQPTRLWPEQCFIWEASEPYLYVRTTADGRVICGGEDEDCPDAESRDALLSRKIAAIGRKLAKLLPAIDTRAQFAWAGSFGKSDTGLPTIGEVPAMKNCWAVLGYGGNGITYSRIAADVIQAALIGSRDASADLYQFRA